MTKDAKEINIGYYNEIASDVRKGYIARVEELRKVGKEVGVLDGVVEKIISEGKFQEKKDREQRERETNEYLERLYEAREIVHDLYFRAR